LTDTDMSLSQQEKPQTTKAVLAVMKERRVKNKDMSDDFETMHCD